MVVPMPDLSRSSSASANTMYVAAWTAPSSSRHAERACSLVSVADDLRQRPQTLLHHPVDGLDGLLAGHLARGVAAHPVGHDVETKRVVDQECVLVRRLASYQRRSRQTR